jgi:hypothetical protein
MIPRIKARRNTGKNDDPVNNPIKKERINAAPAIIPLIFGLNTFPLPLL